MADGSPSGGHLDVFPLADLPDVILDDVLALLTYDQVSQMRTLSRGMDQACRRQLNLGFKKAEMFHTRCHKEVKAKLPRRESCRRQHPYSRNCDVLTAVGTRISLLSMTFKKYIDANLCCFIPGKVIDELFRVLRICLKEHPPRACELLQELRDISSMAMEHFDEKIVPSFRLSPTSAVSLTVFSQDNAPTPSKILAGSFMSSSCTGSDLLGAALCSPVFAVGSPGNGTSTPARTRHFYQEPSSSAGGPGCEYSPSSSSSFAASFGHENPIAALTTASMASKIKESNRRWRASFRKHQKLISNLKKELKSQQETIYALNLLVSSQRLQIDNQWVKLKEHEALLNNGSSSSNGLMPNPAKVCDGNSTDEAPRKDLPGMLEHPAVSYSDQGDRVEDCSAGTSLTRKRKCLGTPELLDTVSGKLSIVDYGNKTKEDDDDDDCNRRIKKTKLC